MNEPGVYETGKWDLHQAGRGKQQQVVEFTGGFELCQAAELVGGVLSVRCSKGVRNE